ncbi:MAG: MerR family transcriptional regulator [Acidobacteria bacterium]|nr:MerR family transcriptional regulator [Acidobacteriota bacterium]
MSVQTIRFYERRGLLKEPPRARSGYRIYAETHLATMQMIRKAQHFGFRLEEIRRLVQLCPIGHDCPSQVRQAGRKQDRVAEIIRMCKGKLTELDGQIRKLASNRKELANALHEIQQGSNPLERFE